MLEIYVLRVQEQYASRLFAPNEGKKLGWTKLFGDKFVTVRKVELSADDPKFKQVGELNTLIKKEPHGFFLRVGIYAAVTLRMMSDKRIYFFFVALPHLSQRAKSAALNMTNRRRVQVAKVEQSKSHLCSLIGNGFRKARTSPERLLVKLSFQSGW